MKKRNSSDAGAGADADAGVGKKHYKLWVLAAIVLVALWFMFTGSVTLKWSRDSDDFDSAILDDLDVLVCMVPNKTELKLCCG